MLESIANWLDSLSEGLSFLLTGCMNGLLIALLFCWGLSLWDKQKLPFNWRRVWSIFVLFWALKFLLGNVAFKIVD